MYSHVTDMFRTYHSFSIKSNWEFVYCSEIEYLVIEKCNMYTPKFTFEKKNIYFIKQNISYLFMNDKIIV